MSDSNLQEAFYTGTYRNVFEELGDTKEGSIASGNGPLRQDFIQYSKENL